MANANNTDNLFDRVFHFQPRELPVQIAIAQFSVVTVISLFMTIKYGGGKVMYIVPAMGAMEVLGYILRLTFIGNALLTSYIVSTLFILLPPIALALVNYTVVGRLLHQAGKPVKVFCWQVTEKRITRIFLGSDFACFFLQAAGGGQMASKDPKAQDIGRATILGGLAIQVIFFTAFVYTLLAISVFPAHGLNKVSSLRGVFWGLWMTTICIYIRNVYRLAEFSTTAVMSVEWAFYVFESGAILFAFVGYCIFHFGMLLNRKREPTDDKPVWIMEFEAINAVASGEKLSSGREGSSGGMLGHV